MIIKQGIYAIVNLRNNVRYVGSAANIYRRWKEHKKFLRRGKHKNHYLQNSWNKHGESCFAFFIIEECKFEYLIETEQKYIDFYDKNGGVYNLNKTAQGFHGRKHSDATKQKISKTKKEQKLSIKHTEESKIKISQALKGKKRQPLTTEHKLKIAASSGHPMSEENKLKLLSVNAKHFSLMSPSGEIVNGTNISLFAREHKLSRQGLCHVLNGNRTHHKGWKKYE